MLLQDQLDELKKIRRTIHTAPESSGEEKYTAQLIRSELEKTNPDEIIDGIGGHGLVAIYKGENSGEGQSLMLRAELDGLKIDEENEFDHASEIQNRMHACGHDGHMTIILGVATYLKENRPKKGSVMLLFQPAEETGEGAGWMLDDPKFKDLKIDHGFALHNLPGYEENHIYIKDETFACASVGLEVLFKGKSSHAAHPEEGINPAQCVADLIKKLGQIDDQARKQDLFSILTITYVQMGEEVYGVSPGMAKVGVTMRAETDERLDSLKKEVLNQIKKVENAFKGDVAFEEKEPFTATVNDTRGMDNVFKAADAAEIPVKMLGKPIYWSEDFGRFREKCPIVLFGLGAGKDSFPLHSEKYDFNDNLIPSGVALFVKLIERYCNE